MSAATALPAYAVETRRAGAGRRWAFPAGFALGLALGAGSAVAAFWQKPERVYQLPGVIPTTVRSKPANHFDAGSWATSMTSQVPEAVVSARSDHNGRVDCWIFNSSNRPLSKVQVWVRTGDRDRAFVVPLGDRVPLGIGQTWRGKIDIGDAAAEVQSVCLLPTYD